ncbi:Thioredoxin family protein [Magnetospirillum sp. LM-5]|uniref:TlpA family protein disulfide reductase n=1 Tax=Magnetospirillum sp. LM-5 TaxID=2681466 RepID=UPI00137F79EB|nr:TlpA disulfide reductase family protein [Magnetospirillum sp. LM-5]CAA7618147.1 Thioredoxin family protein [Magnetospirillum sp. LM-5]
MKSGNSGIGLPWAALALLLAVAAGVAVAVLGTSYTERPSNPSVSEALIAAAPPGKRKAAPRFAFTDQTGARLDLARFKGRVVLVNLWATWCPPCVAEMPSLDRLQARLGGDGFQVVAISLDKGGAAIVKRWFDHAGLSALAIYNAPPGDFAGALLPTSILIDAEGREVWRGEGAYDWVGEEAVATVKALLAER